MSTAVQEAVNITQFETYREKKEVQDRLLRFSESIYPESGILARWIEYTDSITEAPREFLLISGLMLLSSIVQDRYFFNEADQKLKLNLYVILCGVSSESRKTTSINLVRRFIQKYFNKGFLFPSRTNPEALLSLFAGRIPSGAKNENNETIFLPAQTKGLITYSEFAEFMNHSNRDYARGLKELITSAFDDCPPEDILTKTDGRFLPRVDFISFFAASTPEWISHNTRQYELSSGFLARFLIVHAEPSDKCYPFRQLADEYLEREICNSLQALIETREEEIHLQNEAKSTYEQWYYKDKERGKHDTSETAAFLSRHRDYVKKLSALFQLAEDSSAHVKEANMRRAIELIETLRMQLKHLVDEKLFIGKHAQLQLKLEDTIGNEPGITKYEISRKLRNEDTDKVDRALQALRDQRLVEEKKEQTGGRPVTRYWLLV